MNLPLILFRQSCSQSKGRLSLITFAISFGVALILSFSAYTSGIFFASEQNINLSFYAGKPLQIDSSEAENTTKHDVKTDKKATTKTTQATQATQIETFKNVALAARKPSDSTQVVGTHRVQILQVQAIGTNPPNFRDIPYPKPGEFYASAPLAKILEAHPDWQIRYGTKYLGVLPHSFTSSPDEYLVVSGSDQLANKENTRVITTWQVNQKIPSGFIIIQSVMYLGLTILLFPIALLISISAKLGNVQRAQRYSALRLVGATNKQIFWIITIEALIASILGYALGVGIYFAIRPLLAQLPLAGTRFWPESITVNFWHYFLTAFLTFALVYFANGWTVKRIFSSPLSVARDQEMEKKPSILRILPLVSGISFFIWLWYVTPENRGNQNTIFQVLVAVLLIMLGLTISGPWITAKIALIGHKFADKATTYIGWKYVEAHASRISRSVSGVVLALFAGSFFLTAVSDVEFEFDNTLPAQKILADGTVIIAPVPYAENNSQKNSTQFSNNVSNSALLTKYALAARSVPGVSKIQTTPMFSRWVIIPCDGEYLQESCTTLNTENTSQREKVEKNQNISPKNQLVGIAYDSPYKIGETVVFGKDTKTVLNQITNNDDSAFKGPNKKQDSLILKVNSAQTLENLRTEIAKRNLASPSIEILPSIKYSTTVKNDSIISALTKITYFGIIATMIIATISLLVSTYASILERRRTLFTLRLTGMNFREINRMIMVESLAPLFTISSIATIIGIGTGWIFMKLVSATLDAVISPIFLAVLLISMFASALAIRSVLPTVKRATDLSANRQE